MENLRKITEIMDSTSGYRNGDFWHGHFFCQPVNILENTDHLIGKEIKKRVKAPWPASMIISP
jgi:hypothetical protein